MNVKDTPVDDIEIEDYKENDTEGLSPVVNSSDLEGVRQACELIKSKNEEPSRRKVASLTGFGESKSANL